MYVRITWGRLQPGSWDAYERDYRTLVAGGEVPGLLGRMLLRDNVDGDSGGTLSLWDSVESARAYERGAVRRRALPAVHRHFTGTPISHVCEIRTIVGYPVLR